MDIDTFHHLLTAEGQALLARAAALSDPSDGTLLRHLTVLRRTAPAALASAALETVLLRRRAAAKFSRAGAMYFTREALEQATAETVSRHRARRFAGARVVADLGCGIGGDTIALAAQAQTVIAVDRDPLHLAMARENALAYGVAERVRFVQQDITSDIDWLLAAARRTDKVEAHQREPFVPGSDVGRQRLSDSDQIEALFFDPARRTATGRRAFTVEAYDPPLSTVRGWLAAVPAACVKVSPGVDLAEVTALGVGCEVEFISVDGELREAALWFGSLRGADRRATLLPGGHTLTGPPAPPADVRRPGHFLYEPDPAVYRAGLLSNLAALVPAWQIDSTIAYLSADTLVDTPFARAWRVDETLPFSVKAVRRRLRELNVGSVIVKKRGSPLDPQEFARMLHLRGDGQRTVFLTRAGGRPIAIIGDEVSNRR